MRPAIEWTDEMIVALGREIEADPTFHGMDRQGRGLTSIEMHALLDWELVAKRLERKGCENACLGR